MEMSGLINNDTVTAWVIAKGVRGRNSRFFFYRQPMGKQ
jgi:hypothetical protein